MNGLDDLRALGDRGADYLRLRWASVRLAAVEKLSTASARVVAGVIGGAIALGAVVFLGVALALWIGELLGHQSLGFLIAGGALLLIGVFIFVVGRRIFSGSLVRFFVDLFFDDDYEMRR